MMTTAELLSPRLVKPRYGALLTPVGVTRASDELVRAAARLADAFGARLLGVASAPEAAGRMPSAVEQDAVQHVLEAAGERFDELTRSVRAGRRWSRDGGPAARALELRSWEADLLVLNHPSLQASTLDVDALRLWTRRTGCPVLVRAPHSASLVPSRVAVLFDDAPGSLRAFRAALPLLVRSEEVVLVGVGAVGHHQRRALLGRGAAAVELRRLPDGRSELAADALRRTGADTVVMGAWPERLGGWPRRSVTDLILDRGDAHVFLCA